MISKSGGRATDGTRTRDNLNHNQGLYQLSYGHRLAGRQFRSGGRRFKSNLAGERARGGWSGDLAFGSGDQTGNCGWPLEMMDGLEDNLGYRFKDREQLVQSLTHPSIAAELREITSDNQRLEFLGDAVLQLILTEHLYRVLPDQAEGMLTKVRASLVSRRALARCARRLELGAHLRLGKGEEANGGRKRESNLADAFEALLGAVYLDGGIEEATRVTMHVMAADLVKALEGEDVHNPKGQLQEVLQAIRRESPVYRIVAEEGPDHLKQFKAEVIWCGKSLGEGRGSSKKNAESAAAQSALEGRKWEEV